MNCPNALSTRSSTRYDGQGFATFDNREAVLGTIVDLCEP